MPRQPAKLVSVNNLNNYLQKKMNRNACLVMYEISNRYMILMALNIHNLSKKKKPFRLSVVKRKSFRIFLEQFLLYKFNMRL